jgi:hypothetical protein
MCPIEEVHTERYNRHYQSSICDEPLSIICIIAYCLYGSAFTIAVCQHDLGDREDKLTLFPGNKNLSSNLSSDYESRLVWTESITSLSICILKCNGTYCMDILFYYETFVSHWFHHFVNCVNLNTSCITLAKFTV